MFEPTSFASALWMMLAGMVCWGSWPAIYKATGRWRFELFYFDFSIGILCGAIILAGTLGTLFGSPTCWDNLASAERSALVYAAVSGVIWNLANLLLVNGTALVGMAVAFPVAIGLALVLSTIGGYIVMPRGNPVLLAAGVSLVLAAVVVNSLAYRAASQDLKKPSPKGLLACLVAGLLIATVGPTIGKSLSAHPPASAYGITLAFTASAFLSTFVFVPWLLRHPLQGEPGRAEAYWAGGVVRHVAGVAAGVVWTLGTWLTWMAAGLVGIALAMAIGQANPLVAAAWGVFFWREFRGANRRSKQLLGVMFGLYVMGLALLALSAGTKL